MTAGAVSFFMFISILIERSSALGARRSIESLLRLSPTTARRITGDGEEEIEAAELAIGDRVRVRPGERIPGDGVIVNGSSSLDQSSITGESVPVEKKAGEDVFAGTINLTGSLVIEIEKTGEDTTLGKVKSLIIEAEATRTPIMRLIDRYAGYYVPLILMLAGAVLFFTHDMNRAVAMLVVACPCAIVLSAPTASVAALSAASRLGLLIKDVSDLEVMRRVTAVAFDKTGTLTTGRLRVARVIPAPGRSRTAVLRIAAAVEDNSRHPAARAVVDAAGEHGIQSLPAVDGFVEAAGKGVRGSVDETDVLVGRATWLRENGISLEEAPENESAGLSVLYVATGGELIGWIGLEDQLRPGAKAALDQVSRLEIKNRVMLTGDRWAVADRVGNEVGCSHVVAEILPEQKLDAVRLLKKQGHTVAVVGDGVNDAPMLAAGDVSIAMGVAGSDAAVHSASIALMNNEINRIAFLMQLSRKTMNVVAQNLLLSVGSVATVLVLGATGYVHPIAAVLLHTGSALAVVVNSARLVRAGEDVLDHDVTDDRADGPAVDAAVFAALEETQ
jgi:Cd2+/Zn2+-exporting ATPase